MQIFKSAADILTFQLVTMVVGIAIVVLSGLAWLVGGFGYMPAVGAFGGAGWLLAAFLPDALLTQRRQLT